MFPRISVRRHSHTITDRLAYARATSRRASDTTRRALGAVFSDLTGEAIPTEPIMAHHARTFRFATRFFPPPVRVQTIQLYAFFRTIDDLVDESAIATARPESVRAELNAWRRWFSDGMYQCPPRADIGVPLERIIRSHEIPVDYFHSFLDGMNADLEPVRMFTRSEVEHYSYQVASTVGLAMAHIFGTTSPRALASARQLGIAMQLTNILRDVGGDLARGRLYLPKELLEQHGLDPAEVEMMWRSGLPPDERLRCALAEMVAWADEYYRQGEMGIGVLAENVRLPVLLASRMYQRILRQLERNQYDSLHTRVRTSRWQKMQTLSSCLLHPEWDGRIPAQSDEAATAAPVPGDE